MPQKTLLHTFVPPSFSPCRLTSLSPSLARSLSPCHELPFSAPTPRLPCLTPHPYLYDCLAAGLECCVDGGKVGAQVLMAHSLNHLDADDLVVATEARAVPACAAHALVRYTQPQAMIGAPAR